MSKGLPPRNSQLRRSQGALPGRAAENPEDRDLLSHLRERIDDHNRYWIATARDVATRTGWNVAREEVGQAAWRAAVEVESRLEDHAITLAQEMSAGEWLRLLRLSAPYVRETAFGDQEVYGDHSLAVAEVASSYSAAANRIDLAGTFGGAGVEI